jgi:hypothetical protein
MSLKTVKPRTCQMQTMHKVTASGWPIALTMPADTEAVSQAEALEIVEALESFAASLRKAFTRTSS